MRRCVRPAEPAELAEGTTRWTARLLETRRFRWPTVGGRALNVLLRPHLDDMTAGRCAYCDGFPLDVVSEPSVDHFCPKSRFPELAFQWQNLYLACPLCNRCKGELWEEGLLRPDDEDYEFVRFFDVDAMSGVLSPRAEASEGDRARARVTIEILGLNTAGRCKARRDAARRPPPPQDRPYRFLWD